MNKKLNKCSIVRSLEYDGTSCFKKEELIEIIDSLNKKYKFLNLIIIFFIPLRFYE